MASSSPFGSFSPSPSSNSRSGQQQLPPGVFITPAAAGVAALPPASTPAPASIPAAMADSTPAATSVMRTPPVASEEALERVSASSIAQAISEAEVDPMDEIMQSYLQGMGFVRADITTAMQAMGTNEIDIVMEYLFMNPSTEGGGSVESEGIDPLSDTGIPPGGGEADMVLWDALNPGAGEEEIRVINGEEVNVFDGLSMSLSLTEGEGIIEGEGEEVREELYRGIRFERVDSGGIRFDSRSSPAVAPIDYR
jgi:hypothetical protein